jgi:transposase
MEAYSTTDRGQLPYHPDMMVKLLLYAYCVGIPSSRKIEKRTYEDIAFRFLAAGNHSDHDTTAAFRKTRLTALKNIFLHVLVLCREAGLIKAGCISLDSTKTKANASKHKAMSYARMHEKRGS